MKFVESFQIDGLEVKGIPCIKGSGAPTTSTEGAVGLFYMDTDSESGDLYKCIAASNGVYTWVAVGSGNGSGGTGADGKDGVGIKSVKQTTTSTQDGGANVITVTLTDGTASTFTVRNGSKGSAGAKGEKGDTGADGYTPKKGVDYYTDADKTEMVNAVLAALPNGDGVAY